MFKTNTSHASGRGRRFRGLKIAAAVVASLIAIFLVAVQLILSSSFLKKMSDKYISEYVDADVYVGDIRASVVKSFPNLSIRLDDVRVTYPHERFADFDSIGVPGVLRGAGRGNVSDTLASFRSMTLSINYLAAMFGRIRIHEASIDHPRIYAHSYIGGAANWDILKNIASDPESVEDTSVTVLPPISVARISMTGRPRVIYTDCADTVYAALLLKKMAFHGRLSTRKVSSNHIGLHIDSMFVSGRLPADTLAMAMDRFDVVERRGRMHFGLSARAFAGMNGYGRLILPIHADGAVRLPKSGDMEVDLEEFNASIASLKMHGNGTVRICEDSTYVRAEVNTDACRLSDIIADFGGNALTLAKSIDTEAEVTFKAQCDGFYNPSSGRLPKLIAELVVPKTYIRCPGVHEGYIDIDVDARTDDAGKLDVVVEKAEFSFAGVDIDMTAKVIDLTGNDPLIEVEGSAYASFGEACKLLPDSLGIQASGDVDALLDGSIRLSQLTPYGLYHSGLDGYVRSRELSVRTDSIYAWIGSPEIRLSTVANKIDGDMPKGTRILALSAKADSLYASLDSTTVIRGRALQFLVQNAAKIRHGREGTEHNPIVAGLSIGKLFFSGADSLFAGVIGSENSFRIYTQEKGEFKIPVISLSSNTRRAFARSGPNRVGMRDAGFTASARMNTFERSQRRKLLLDSLQRVYPGVERDSLFAKAYRNRMSGREIPDYLKEEDFRKQDIDFRLGETMAKYMKEWNMAGDIDVKRTLVITPYFPIRNEIDGLKGSVSNDAVHIDSLTFRPGKSDLSAKGALRGLRRALLGHGPLTLDLSLTSKRIDANELLAAYTAGAAYEKVSHTGVHSDMEDEAYLDSLAAAASQVADTSYALVVVPANIIANITLQANEIDYSDLDISWLSADLTMKERCIQLTNALATSNMGDIYFEGFYSTKTKKDIKAGFDLNLSDITADKVVRLFPAVDTIMPMLTSFKGMLNCEMAATSDLDTNMNFVTSSMNGVMRISGRDVTLEESDAFKKLAKMLMFKNKKSGKLADISVSGLISNNRIEIFPFVLKIDRYTLAMSGMQNFDQTFRYHVSVLKSPIPFRFGINIFGNFDDWKYRIGKAQYKNTDVPVFTAQLDTMQMNLVTSIHNIFSKGVNAAIRQNTHDRMRIDSSKAILGFNPDVLTDSLESGRMKILDSLQTAYDQPVDSALNARIDSLVTPITPQPTESVGEKSDTKTQIEADAPQKRGKGRKKKDKAAVVEMNDRKFEEEK